MMKAALSISVAMPLSLFLFISLVGITTAGPHYPVVLVPGDGGSQLVVKLNKTTSKHWFCEKHTSDYESLWVNLEEFAPPLIYCFVENMMLIYDNKTRTTREPQGVDIKTVGFGDTASVEWLDPSWASHQFSSVSYFYPIVNDLVAVGYKRNVSVRGAPFDFRKAPNELATYYNELKLLIEQTYDINNNTRCVLVAHSYGNPVLLYFLNHQPQSWKDKYIQAFVALAGVWGGAIKPLRLYASGDSLGVVIVGSNTVRPEQRSMPSTAFLMPSNKLWGPEEVMVVTEHRNYTVADFKDYFHDLNFPDGWQMHLDTQGLLNNLTAPNVHLHCVHGVGLPTPGTLVFGKGEFPDTFPKNIPDDGDGTVNIRSLLLCLDWRSKQQHPVNHTALKGAEHMEILADPRARKYVVNVALGQL